MTEKIYINDILYKISGDDRIHTDIDKVRELWLTRPEHKDEVCDFCGHVGVPVYRDGGRLRRCPECGKSWYWHLNTREAKLYKAYMN